MGSGTMSSAGILVGRVLSVKRFLGILRSRVYRRVNRETFVCVQQFTR